MAVMNRKTPRTRSGTVPILHLPGVDLRDAASFYRHHHPEGSTAATVPEAVAAYLEHQGKKSLSRRHSDALRLHCETFALKILPFNVSRRQKSPAHQAKLSPPQKFAPQSPVAV